MFRLRERAVVMREINVAGSAHGRLPINKIRLAFPHQDIRGIEIGVNQRLLPGCLQQRQHIVHNRCCRCFDTRNRRPESHGKARISKRCFPGWSPRSLKQHIMDILRAHGWHPIQLGTLPNVRRVNRRECTSFTREFRFADGIERRGTMLIAQVLETQKDPFVAGRITGVSKRDVRQVLRL